jgi:hypothetical protein
MLLLLLLLLHNHATMRQHDAGAAVVFDANLVGH